MERGARDLLERRGDPGGAGVLEPALGVDPRFLSDVRLLAALHAELRHDRGEAGAVRALLQTGFLHGLRDALGAGAGGAGRPACAAVAMRLAPGGALLRGSWPARLEAEAVLVGRGRGETPACWVSCGYTAGWISGLWDADVLVVERRCAVRGDPACEFEVREAGAWAAEAATSPALAALLAALPFTALRGEVLRERDEAGADDDEGSGAFDPASPAIHVWGPVMVVPYAGDETAVAVDAVSREPSAAGVTVVVIDLQGAIVDDGFGAVALERVVETIEACGAEAILAGLSPLSARVVAGIGSGRPLVVRKDLRSAIATAFQIAEAQRHAV